MSHPNATSDPHDGPGTRPATDHADRRDRRPVDLADDLASAVAEVLADLPVLPPGRDPGEVAAVVRRLVDGAACRRAPLPGSGRTALRWQLLRTLAAWDVAVGRLVEAHLDAVAVLAELGGATVGPGEVWAVWAAEPPGTPVVASRRGGGWTLSGRKPWCSGATMATHALVTAQADDGRRLFAVELGDRAVPAPGHWAAGGMAQTDTWPVDLDALPAVPVGGVRGYLDRPGFWHGAIGVAACWLGGADAVLRPLVARATSGRADPHALAHLGACAASVHAAGAVLASSAADVDGDPYDRTGRAELVARSARAVVEHAATTAIDRVGRALGAAPLCLDARHARHVEDLTVYLRQSHAERDLEALGARYAAQQPTPERHRAPGGAA